LSGYKVTSLGGRNEVENEVKRLQDEDNSGKLAKRQLFIFDNDRKISGLLSTNSVKVSQLQRYCIENYLLDDIVLFDMVSAHAQKTMVSRGEFTQLLEQLALAQLDNVVIRQVYAELEPESPGLRGAEIKGKKLSEVATLLSSRILRLRQQIAEIDIPSWEADFVLSCETKRREVEAEWRLEWKTLASGKQIIDDLYAQFQISMKKIEFKKSIMRRLREKQADSWRIIDQILRANLA